MNRYKATFILIIVSLGFLITFPFKENLWGGLLYSAFSASMIGGFADWYGVTALFRKPLGIPFKTQIIARNREAIFDSLSSMVSEELLSKDFLRQLVSEYDATKLLSDYLLVICNDKKVVNSFCSIMADALDKLDMDTADTAFSKAAVESLHKLNIPKILISGAEISMENGYDDKILDFAANEVIELVSTKDFHALLFDMIDKTKKSYESGYKRRAFVNTLVLDVFLQLSSESLTTVIQEKVIEYLKTLKNPTDINRSKLKHWAYSKFNIFKTSKAYQNKFENWFFEQFNYSFIHEQIKKFAESNKQKFFSSSENIEKFTDYACILLADVSNRLSNDVELQKNVDAYMKLALNSLVDKIHSNIEAIVKENLNKYSDDMLIALIESKAGDDLQLIRINGSIVGGLVGMLIFILTKLIRGV